MADVCLMSRHFRYAYVMQVMCPAFLNLRTRECPMRARVSVKDLASTQPDRAGDLSKPNSNPNPPRYILRGPRNNHSITQAATSLARGCIINCTRRKCNVQIQDLKSRFRLRQQAFVHGWQVSVMTCKQPRLRIRLRYTNHRTGITQSHMMTFAALFKAR